jgi:hypothetical protein
MTANATVSTALDEVRKSNDPLSSYLTRDTGDDDDGLKPEIGGL